MAKATLFDLYRTGKEFTIEEGDMSVTVYLQKMNAIHQQKAQRKANAARANVLALQRDDAGDQRAEYETGLIDQFPTKQDRIHLLVADKTINKRSKVEAEIAAEEEWSNDGYLEGLQESWEDEMQELWVSESTRTEESERVYDEIARYAAQVTARMDPMIKRFAREYEEMSESEIHKLVVDRQLRAEADMTWLNEYRMQEIFYSVRDEKDHSKFMFGSRQELDELPNEVTGILLQEISTLGVDLSVGKELQESQDS